MAKRREVDRGELPDIDQVLLELFAGQLLLERSAGPEAPVARPARARPAGEGRRPAQEAPGSLKGEGWVGGAGRIAQERETERGEREHSAAGPSAIHAPDRQLTGRKPAR
jgi:hypothetical protein